MLDRRPLPSTCGAPQDVLVGFWSLGRVGSPGLAHPALPAALHRLAESWAVLEAAGAAGLPPPAPASVRCSTKRMS